MDPQTPQQAYQNLVNKHTIEQKHSLKKQSRFGWLRLCIVVITILTVYATLHYAKWIWISVIITGVATFLFVVSKDAGNNARLRFLENLLRINRSELEALKGNFSERPTGIQFLPPHHPFAHDLDVFGLHSLFQYINRAATEQGQQRLAQLFLNPMPPQAIRAMQQSVIEIKSQLAWRQDWEALLLQNSLTLAAEARAMRWLSQTPNLFLQRFWPFLVQLWSFITISSAMAAVLQIISFSVFSSLFGIYLIVSIMLSSRSAKAYHALEGLAKEVDLIKAALQHLAGASWQSAKLQALHASVNAQGATAYEEMKNLGRALHNLDMRLNVIVYFFLNAFLLWDVRQMLRLNRWHQRNKNAVPAWFDAIAEMEVIHSLATLAFNHPGWCMPSVEGGFFCLQAQTIRHPLIHAGKNIPNDFAMQGTGKVALVTGSNMAGKSTFLRTIGVNIILAQMGAPVCAAYMQLAPTQLASSMRIADNLAESTSTFYAELKKLQTIIASVRAHQPVLVLLDEVLRGTNSLDRHLGLEALIKQIIKESGVAIIATHDVEVARLEKEYPAQLQNYHFDVQVDGEELFFDYKLKEGVCQSLNASILMKKIGIEL